MRDDILDYVLPVLGFILVPFVIVGLFLGLNAVFNWTASNACSDYGQAYGVQTFYTSTTNCLVQQEGRQPIRIQQYITSVEGK